MVARRRQGSSAGAAWAARVFALDYARRVLADLDTEIAAATARLADGTPATLDAYRQMVGERRGLLKARAMLTERFSDEEQATFKLNKGD